MKKKQAEELLESSDKCSRCKHGKMKIIEGFINIGNFFLRCEECGYQYDN